MDSKELKFLAGKVADGTATEKELIAYNAYLDQLEKQGTDDPLNAIEKERLKENLKNRIDAHINNIDIEKTPLPIIKGNNPVARKLVAAVILIVLSLSTYYWYIERTQEKEAVVNQALLVDIKPGGNKAMLTLADGSQIVLDDTDDGTVAEQGATRVIKTADGKLLYEKSTEKQGEGQASGLNIVETPRGGQYQMVLPDGSKVWLNAASSITFPTDFSTTANRTVSIRGEVYFEVATDKKRPFIVNTATQFVEVLGTHFNVAAYSDNHTHTTLLKGAVRVNTTGTIGGQHQQEVVLRPGEQSTVMNERIAVRSVDLDEVLAWKDGYFKFKGNLEDIMSQIARWYDVTIDYDKKTTKPLAFGGKISRNRSIEDVLKMIEETGQVRFKIVGRRVMVQD
ncbi:FecR domain-containing protein [Olivibacter sp. SDN3]|uniref:FecR family protein n=1 Tax=Olivibacter sp. SDN3 TaxID=2764720 RepID=UPI00165182F2|nr:FecR domain-containing protein [Olivibacter sp. SDN3]QNL49583.1 FecR domain-containing protein [Olivibacter sp. SDN3]